MNQKTTLLTILFCTAGTASALSPTSDTFTLWGRQTLKTIERDHRIFGQSGYYEDHQRKDVGYAWSHAILLLAYAKAAQVDETYRKPLEDLIEHLQKYWVAAGGIGGYDCLPHPRPSIERYYDDNAWIAMGLIDAWHATGCREYLRRAEQTIHFCLSGIDPQSGGIWWREFLDKESQKTKNTCSIAPTAFACLRYYEITHEPSYLQTARELLAWLDSHLQDEDGLYFDHLGPSGRIGRRKWTYNSAMPLRCYTLLFRLTGRPEYLEKAARIAEAAADRWYDASSGAIHCESMFAFTLIEAWVELARATGQERWQKRARTSMHYVHDQVRDPNGRYSKRWDAKNDSPITRWKLLYPAAAARAYWVLAETEKDKSAAAKNSKDKNKEANKEKQNTQ